MKEISPQMQNQIAQYQQLQQQLQLLGSQRLQLETKLREIETSMEELSKTKEDTIVYKSIGTILVKTEDREALKKELEEHKETVTIRIKAIQKQEKSLSDRFEQLQQKISESLGGKQEKEDEN